MEARQRDGSILYMAQSRHRKLWSRTKQESCFTIRDWSRHCMEDEVVDRLLCRCYAFNANADSV